MARPLRVAPQPISYSIPDAAEAVGYSETIIKNAIDAGLIPRRYGTATKPVLLHEDVVAWVKSLPTERP